MYTNKLHDIIKYMLTILRHNSSLKTPISSISPWYSNDFFTASHLKKKNFRRDAVVRPPRPLRIRSASARRHAPEISSAEIYGNLYTISTESLENL